MKKSGWLSQIEVHSTINALLVTSLAVLVGWRFFSTPWTSGGWINAAGGPLGLIAFVLVSGLLVLVARERTFGGNRDSQVVWMAGWFGMILVAMVAANVDRTVAVPWIGLRTIEWGCVATLAVVGGLAVYFQRRTDVDSERSNFVGPIWIASVVAVLFAIRGGLVDGPDVWQYTMAIASVVVIVTAVGVLIRSVSAQYIGVAGLFAGTVLLRRVNPNGIFPIDQPAWTNLFVVLMCVLSGIWSIVHVLRRNRQATSRGFAVLPNIVLMGSAVWVLLGGLMQWMLDSDSFLLGNGSALANGMGLAAVGASIGLAGISWWHERIFVRVSAGWLISIGVAIAVASVITKAGEVEGDARFLWVMFALAVVVLGWGVVWLKRNVWRAAFARWQVARIEAIENGLSVQVPVFGLILGTLILTSSLFAVAYVEPRSLRYLAAMTPFVLAFGFGSMSDQGSRRMFQLVSLAIATLGFVLLGWADLPAMNHGNDELSWLVRLVLVLAGLMFVYGALVTRWTRVGDSWLRSLREMTVATCAIAVMGFGLLVWSEQIEFVDGIGCGVSAVEASSLAVVVVGMIMGLVTIAMRPKLDPFAIPESARTAYVYAAQAVTVLLIGHLYWTMPWLFQFGLRQYWPYILMAIAFGGVGVANILAKRDLKVLSQPLFNTAAILPVLVSIAIWTIDSQADASMVLFVAGLAYLMISQSNGSMLAGAAAIVLGNLALWVLYNRLPNISFANHPQLWLIPPAISVLVASQLSRDRLNAGQLATVRYLCVAVIYVSSTSEIFIRGIGDNLWPPVVLAVLAVIGIFAGMALQVRAYLYLGSLFLLMAMITMVSHVHQRLGHVWPWWAFGIGAGMSILIMFGVFEKHRNKMKSISDKLQKWDL